jgi:hypothetical protein
VAAAIVTSAELPATVAAQVSDLTQKFVVHPHLSTVSSDDRLLLRYLRSIYSDRPALQTSYPSFSAFGQLGAPATLSEATRTIAGQLALEMSRKHANPGLLFGFILRRSDGSQPHGVIKADLDEEERFHMSVADTGEWSWDAVSKLLPPPRTEFAKFAIAPQPGGVGAAGIRDITDNEAAAAYFLIALQLAVPKTTGTQARVASAAIKSGYKIDAVHAAFKGLTTQVPVEVFVADNFPRIPPKEVERLVGRPERPMPTIVAQDPFLRVYKTRSPRFELVVDETVTVAINGRVVTVTLPPGDPIQESTRER